METFLLQVSNTCHTESDNKEKNNYKDVLLLLYALVKSFILEFQGNNKILMLPYNEGKTTLSGTIITKSDVPISKTNDMQFLFIKIKLRIQKYDISTLLEALESKIKSNKRFEIVNDEEINFKRAKNDRDILWLPMAKKNQNIYVFEKVLVLVFQSLKQQLKRDFTDLLSSLRDACRNNINSSDPDNKIPGNFKEFKKYLNGINQENKKEIFARLKTIVSKKIDGEKWNIRPTYLTNLLKNGDDEMLFDMLQRLVNKKGTFNKNLEYDFGSKIDITDFVNKNNIDLNRNEITISDLKKLLEYQSGLMDQAEKIGRGFSGVEKEISIEETTMEEDPMEEDSIYGEVSNMVPFDTSIEEKIPVYPVNEVSIEEKIPVYPVSEEVSIEEKVPVYPAYEEIPIEEKIPVSSVNEKVPINEEVPDLSFLGNPFDMIFTDMNPTVMNPTVMNPMNMILAEMILYGKKLEDINMTGLNLSEVEINYLFQFQLLQQQFQLQQFQSQFQQFQLHQQFQSQFQSQMQLQNQQILVENKENNMCCLGFE